MKSVYVIYYIDIHNDLIECEVFSKLEYAQKFEEDLVQLYGDEDGVIGFLKKPIDIISCTNRNSNVNSVTGYIAESKYSTHILTGEYINIDHDSDFWNDDQPER